MCLTWSQVMLVKLARAECNKGRERGRYVTKQSVPPPSAAWAAVAHPAPGCRTPNDSTPWLPACQAESPTPCQPHHPGLVLGNGLISSDRMVEKTVMKDLVSS